MRTTCPIPHEPTKMERMYWDGNGNEVTKDSPSKKMLASHYVGKGHKARFYCPICGKRTWQHLNFLGNKDLVCTFTKITKEKRSRP